MNTTSLLEVVEYYFTRKMSCSPSLVLESAKSLNIAPTLSAHIMIDGSNLIRFNGRTQIGGGFECFCPIDGDLFYVALDSIIDFWTGITTIGTFNSCHNLHDLLRTMLFFNPIMMKKWSSSYAPELGYVDLETTISFKNEESNETPYSRYNNFKASRFTSGAKLLTALSEDGWDKIIPLRTPLGTFLKRIY